MTKHIDLGVELTGWGQGDAPRPPQACGYAPGGVRYSPQPGGGYMAPLADLQATGFNVPPRPLDSSSWLSSSWVVLHTGDPDPPGGGGGLQWPKPYLPPITWLSRDDEAKG